MKVIKHLLFALIFTLLIISGILGYSYYSHKKSAEYFVKYFPKNITLKYKEKKIHFTYAELKDVELTIKPQQQQTRQNPFIPPSFKITIKRIIIKNLSIDPIKMDISYIDIDSKGPFKIKKFLKKFFSVETNVSVHGKGYLEKNILNRNTLIIIRNIANIKSSSKIEFPKSLKIDISKLNEEIKKGITKEVKITIGLESTASSKIKKLNKKDFEKIFPIIDAQINNAQNIKQKNNLKKIKKLLTYIEKKAYRLESQPIHFSISLKNLNISPKNISTMNNPAQLIPIIFSSDLEIETD